MPGPHAALGSLPYDFGHLLGAVALMLSFGLLYQRRVGAVITIYGAQAWVLAVAGVWQGWVQQAPALYLIGAVTLAAKGIAIPAALRVIVRRLDIHRAVETALGVFPSMAIGLALAALSISVVLPTTVQSQAITRDDLALALSVVMLGLLMMITRRTALTQVIGFLSLENGLILAAIAVPGLPLVLELSAAILVLVAAFVFGVFFFRIRERFDSLDVHHLDRIGGRHR